MGANKSSLMTSVDYVRLPIEHLRNANPAWIRKDMGDLNVLAKSLKHDDQKLPVLADSTFRVIDGARRIEAADLLGWLDVLVVCTSDFDEISRLMQAARSDAQPMTWLETMELIQVVRALYLPYSRIQATQTKRSGRTPARQRDGGIAVAMPPVLGLTKSLIDELSRGWSMINDGKRFSFEARERMRAAVAEVEATGHFYSLITAMTRAANPLQPRVSNRDVIKAQRATFTGAITGLRGAALALPNPTDIDPGHSLENLQGWDAGLTEILQRLYQVRKEVRNNRKAQGDQENDTASA